MAVKIEWVVVDGCIQDGSKTFKKGDVYVPPNKKLQEALEAEGKIAARGKLPAPGSRVGSGNSSLGGQGGAPVLGPGSEGGGNLDDDDDDDNGD